MWEFIDKIVFINLESRKDRLEHMQLVCNKFPSEKVIRFNAIETKGCGLIGCGKSHVGVVEMAIENNWKNVLILEDDVEWNKFEEGYEKLEKLVERDYDVILLGGIIKGDNSYDKETSRVNCVQTMSSYLVNSKFYTKLLNNLKEGITKLEIAREHWLYGCDQYWKHLQPHHNFYIIVPNLMYQRNEYSDNAETYVDYTNEFIL
jgi:GR25 family glycosyltransferase involved in LPS biosynthesis